jgi:hypothetical protein
MGVAESCMMEAGHMEDKILKKGPAKGNNFMKYEK